jgi:hypothetical protein
MTTSSTSRIGDEITLEVLGLGRVVGVVEQVDELIQEGVRGLAWRVTLRLPDGTTAQGITRGRARMAFIDPRHRIA